MKDDLECAAAHRRRLRAKKELEATANRDEIPKARAAFEAANAEWSRITLEVFRQVMAGAARGGADAA
jgi:hypothetical protein